MQIPLYMAVSRDKYELPLCVEETTFDLARKLGIAESSVRKGLRRRELGKKSGYVKVFVELTAEEWYEHQKKVLMMRERAERAAASKLERREQRWQRLYISA